MPSPHELSSQPPTSPYAAELAARNTRIYEHYFGEKEKQFTEFLESLSAAHLGLINAELISAAANKAGVAGGEEALRQRESGLMNDEICKQPGIFITGLLDYRKAEQLKNVLDEAKGLKEEYAAESELWIESLEQTSSIELRYGLHLPAGMFEHTVPEEPGQTYLYVYTRGRVNEHGVVVDLGIGLPMLKGGYFDQSNQNVTGVIGRIEGAGGTLWQNPASNPDGTPRQKTEAAA